LDAHDAEEAADSLPARMVLSARLMIPFHAWPVLALALVSCSSPETTTDGAPEPPEGPESPDASSLPDALSEPDALAPDSALVDSAEPLPDGDAPSPRDGCGRDPGENDRVWTLEHDGRTRRFAVHLPPGYDRDRPTPVVIDLHGRGSDATQQSLVSGMRRKADESGFIAVHPDGIGQTWNAGFCCGTAMSEDVDDVGFVARILDALEDSTCVDEGRVFATGLSNGGYMAHRLGCELSDRIAAIAPVAGPNGTVPCSPAEPVSVLHFHGTDDSIVPYDGFVGRLSVPETMRDWASRNGCGAESHEYFAEGDVRCERWEGCRDGVDVALCTIEGGGHQWPGGTTIPFLGDNTDDIDATDAMWELFEAHGR
jgi:polyhydroxybutyrate depolymerase